MLVGRRKIVGAVRRLERLGLVVGSTGNVSVRHRSTFMITPTRRRYAQLRPWEIVTWGPAETQTRRGPQPSRESELHRRIYEARPDVEAIVHHHGPYAIAASFASEGELSPRLEEAEYFEIGPVRIAAAAPAGSERLAESCVATLGASRAVLLAGHGLIAVGSTLDQAMDVSVAVEHEARVAWLLSSSVRWAR